MKKVIYRVITCDKGFLEFEEKVSEMLTDGWKPIGGIAFNHNQPHQAVAKVIEAKEKERPKTIIQIGRPLTANEAMKKIDELT